MRTQPGLQPLVGIWRNVLKETTAALFRLGAPLRQLWSGPVVERELPKRGTAEESTALLKRCQGTQFFGRRYGALGMVENGSSRLRLETRFPPVSREYGIERRGVQRRGNATPHDHRPGAGIVSQPDVGRKRNGHEHGGILQHPGDTVAVAIVASAQEKEEIVRILAESLLCVLRRYRASFLTVTRQAGSAVTAEGRALEELLAVRWAPGSCCRILRETINTQ